MSTKNHQRIAVYPGSFDPVTNGHLDIIRRSAAIFDSIIVTVAANSQKDSLFTDEERCDMIHIACKDIPNVQVVSFSGLLINFAEKMNATVIIRGLRAVTDFDYEFAMALMNKHLDSNIETLFLATSDGYSFVSSSLVKEVFKLGGDVSDKVPPCVIDGLIKKLNKTE